MKITLYNFFSFSSKYRMTNYKTLSDNSLSSVDNVANISVHLNHTELVQFVIMD